MTRQTLFGRAALVLGSLLILTACAVVLGERPTPLSPLLGGQGTVDDVTENAFSRALPGLDRYEERLFFVGNSFFNQNWVMAPSSTRARDGLGPLFNSRSCSGCHFKDGRGRPPKVGEEGPTGFLLRLSVPGRDLRGMHQPEPTYGGQFQNMAIQRVAAEGVLSITYTEISGQYADGTPYTLRQPTYAILNPAYGPFHPEMMLSPRIANQMIGLGLLEAVPEAAIFALADPADVNGDGISGRPNWVWDALNNRLTLGRFGWKAGQPSLLQQTAAAFNGDMGITTSLFLAQNCTAAQADCMAALNGGEPEISDDDLLKVVLYASTLAVPKQRDHEDPTVRQGWALFQQIGCAECHTPTLQTGIHPTIPALSNQTIHPFTDLLLHDMGEGLADHRPEWAATGREWRTPPLWGIGLFETVNGHTNYLHDGRARSLEEAILWHGGEAEAAQKAFIGLSKAEREALIRFLKSL